MLSNPAIIVVLCLAITAIGAEVCPNLGSAANFTLLAASTITNTGLSVITGNVGVYPGTAVTGFPPGVVKQGIIQPGNAMAQNDVTTAYNTCKDAPFTKDLTGIDLAGLTLRPGVYKFSSTAAISAGGILTLKGEGIYIFQVGSAITTGANAKIVVRHGATAGCIYWQVGSSVTHGADSQFLGNILAYASVTFGNNVTYKGSVYARTAAITLIDDTITDRQSCNVECEIYS
uniref:Ice-binding family protein n=1 Tax=Adineta environmental sample TaxID=1193592 RepID=A0AAU7VF11_9BILA